jgi:arsenate reductase-like glutaredoxin family protein
MSELTIFHNPESGMSRNTFTLIRRASIERREVDCLKTWPFKGDGGRRA